MPTTRNQQKQNPVTCDKCKTGIKVSENACKCLKCNGLYHATCQGIRASTFKTRWNHRPTCGGYLDIECKACKANPDRRPRRGARRSGARNTTHEEPEPQPSPLRPEQESNTSLHTVHSFYGGARPASPSASLHLHLGMYYFYY